MGNVSHTNRGRRPGNTEPSAPRAGGKLQQMFDESPRVAAQAKLADAMNSSAAPVQRQLADAYVYAAHAQLNHKWPASVDDFVEILRELKANDDLRYKGLKAALLKGMPEETAAEIESSLEGGTRFVDMDFSSDDSGDEDYQSGHVLPNSKKIRKIKRKDTGNVETNKMFGGKTRPKSHGTVKIEKQKISHVSGKDIERPVKVSGLVFPTTTQGRQNAPEPSSGMKVGIKWKEVGSETTRNTGIVDMQKGHLMALELGGPDISSNIVPQFGNWQGNGAWRRAEKRVLELAQAAEARGYKIRIDVDVTYKEYKDLSQGTMKGLLIPKHFKITATEVDKQGRARDNGTIILDEDQDRDETDERVAFRMLDEADEDEASEGLSDMEEVQDEDDVQD
jgi:hypothetical protein